MFLNENSASCSFFANFLEIVHYSNDKALAKEKYDAAFHFFFGALLSFYSLLLELLKFMMPPPTWESHDNFLFQIKS